MNYTPELIQPDPERIVPSDEGVARLREIREAIERQEPYRAKNAEARNAAAREGDL